MIHLCSLAKMVVRQVDRWALEINSSWEELMSFGSQTGVRQGPEKKGVMAQFLGHFCYGSIFSDFRLASKPLGVVHDPDLLSPAALSNLSFLSDLAYPFLTSPLWPRTITTLTLSIKDSHGFPPNLGSWIILIKVCGRQSLMSSVSLVWKPHGILPVFTSYSPVFFTHFAYYFLLHSVLNKELPQC